MLVFVDDPSRLAYGTTLSTLVLAGLAVAWALVVARLRVRRRGVGPLTVEGVVEAAPGAPESSGDPLRIVVRQRRDARDGWVMWRETGREIGGGAFIVRLASGERILVEPGGATRYRLPFGAPPSDDERSAERERVVRLAVGDRVAIYGGVLASDSADGSPYRAGTPRSLRDGDGQRSLPLVIAEPRFGERLERETRRGVRTQRLLSGIVSVAVLVAGATAFPVAATERPIVDARKTSDHTLRLELDRGLVFELGPDDLDVDLPPPLGARVFVAHYGPFLRPGRDIGMPVLSAILMSLVFLVVALAANQLGRARGVTSEVEPLDESGTDDQSVSRRTA